MLFEQVHPESNRRSIRKVELIIGKIWNFLSFRQDDMV